ncbi:short-chain dehydrogenase [Zopfia rhizophila CBS 207.26]|uniref:Short-chain dehydrogenase n=1 Tax=Zopfia rhizophila CBS 207.26 TaxID=1314779 RepID=A0A6A6EQG8_9PEZI|nr:short-chain dehydrogenase [Zopfia rhizophila CBS 207.26]
MSSHLTYLITGANRRIGKGFTASLLQRPSTTVIATAAGSKVIIVKLDSQAESDAANAVLQLQEEYGITSLDVVIANAGIAHSGNRIAENSTEAIRDHFNTNTIGPVLLFQAVQPLLKASKSGSPIFIAISTLIGSIGGQESLAGFPAKFSPYGASKAASNWFIRRIHFDEPWLTSFVFHPGLVLTDMASTVSGPGVNPVTLGAITVDVSVNGMLKTMESASREISGTLQNYDGATLPW